MIKGTITFDMDGTLGGFYDIPTWEKDLENENVRPYAEALPKVDMVELKRLLLELKKRGWNIAIVSWLADNSSQKFKAETRKAKRDWLSKYDMPYDEIHLVSYGTDKAKCLKCKEGEKILFDDNIEVRAKWQSKGVDYYGMNEQNILWVLEKILQRND